MSLRLAQGPLMQQGSSADLVAYKVSTGATSFYALDQARTSDTEPDLIGSKDLFGTAAAYGGSSPSPLLPGGTTYSGTQGLTTNAGGSTFDLQQDWTVGLWLYGGSLSTNHVAFTVSLSSSNTKTYFFIWRSDKNGGDMVLQLASNITGYYAPTSGGMGVSEGAWHHVHLWRDYSTTASVDTFGWRIDNGTATTITRASISGSLGADIGNQEFGFGNRPGGGLTWIGSLLHGTIWEGKVLSTSEQNEDYTVESTGVIP